jgi:hypothetical protein
MERLINSPTIRMALNNRPDDFELIYFVAGLPSSRSTT